MKLLFLLASFLAICSARHVQRIVGGQVAMQGQVPWQVGLRIGNILCGGSLIDQMHVMTAAHCVESVPASSIEVRLGGLTWSTPSQIVGVSSIFVHPSYSPAININFRLDIAILKLQTQAVLGTNVMPLRLADENDPTEDEAGMIVRTSGYGNTDPDNSMGAAQELRYVDIPLVSDTQCGLAAQMQSAPFNADRYVCAGSDGKDSCGGDSGGALVADFNNVQLAKAIGVVSYGTSNGFSGASICADENHYGVYTSVKFAKTWIDSVISNEVVPSAAKKIAPMKFAGLAILILAIF